MQRTIYSRYFGASNQGGALFNVDGLWYYVQTFNEQPQPSLVEILWQTRLGGLNFYHLAYALKGFGLTLDDLYAEEPCSTMNRLREAAEKESQMLARLSPNDEHHKYTIKHGRESIEQLMSDLNSDSPAEVRQLLDMALAGYDTLAK